MNILLVEDNPGDVLLLRAALADIDSTDPSPVHVGCVAEALTRLDTERFDVVLLDLSLPDAQGLDAVMRVRDHPGDVPIVVLSGLSDEATALSAVQAGAQDYLLKGTTGGPLVRALHYAIERHRMMAALRSLSLVDDLTGLYNRRGFVTLAERQRAFARRLSASFVLVFADLDRLKYINDTFGHLEGDRALIDAGRLLRRMARQSDIVARIGGDEFAVAVASDTDGDSQAIADRLRARFDQHNGTSDRPYPLFLSIGIVIAEPFDTSSVEELLARADAKMYVQKRSHRAGPQGTQSVRHART